MDARTLLAMHTLTFTFLASRAFNLLTSTRSLRARCPSWVQFKRTKDVGVVVIRYSANPNGDLPYNLMSDVEDFKSATRGRLEHEYLGGVLLELLEYAFWQGGSE